MILRQPSRAELVEEAVRKAWMEKPYITAPTLELWIDMDFGFRVSKAWRKLMETVH